MGVSVLVASYNCENYVEECLKCLLNQSYKDVEIIVCDDCSTDNTRTILRRYANEGKIIRFERQVAVLEKNPSFDFVSTGLQKFYETGEKIDIFPKKEIPTKDDFLFTIPFMHATTLFRREILNRVNGYRIAWETRRGQDYDLFMRIFAAGGRGININEIHYFYRCFTGYTPRHAYKYRVGEFIIRYKGFKALKLGFKSVPYIIKPLILGLIPQGIINKVTGH